MNKNVRYKIKLHKFQTLIRFKALILTFLCFGVNSYGNVVSSENENVLYQIVNTTKVNINLKDKPLEEIIFAICRQAKVECGFQKNIEMDKNTKYSFNANNLTVKEALDKLLKDTPYDYKIYDNKVVIVLRVDEKKETSTAKANDVVTIGGKVVDSENKPILGATILVKGTTRGAISDSDGAFALTVNQGAELDISYMGMVTTTRKITSTDYNLIITMKSDFLAVDEVVVTGYGNVKRSSFTGNSVVVKREDLLKVSKTNVIKALQTFDPSFRIKENNQWGSDPNALPEVYIRGESGIGLKELDKDPLAKSKLRDNPNLPTFIMDGFEINVTQLYDMDPNRIESITILKDAAATALYGSRAANGVVVITTVTPKPGKLNISYNFVADFVTPDLTDYNLMNAAEKLAVEKKAGFYDYTDDGDKVSKLTEYNSKLLNIKKGVDTYWMSQPLSAVFNHKHSFYADGGGENIRFGIDMQYANGDGVMKGSSRDKFSTGFYLQYTYKKIQIRNYVSYNMTNARESNYGSFSDYAKQLPYNDFLDEHGNYLKELKFGNNRDNPLYEAGLNNFDKTRSDDLVNNLSLHWNIMNDLLVKGQLSVTKSSSNGERFIDPESNKNQYKLSLTNMSSGELYLNDNDNFSLDMNAYASYIKDINKHNINLQAGFNVKESQSEGYSSTYLGFPSGKLHSINYAQRMDDKTYSQESATRLVGFLASLNYSYNNIYLMDASYRIDGSSAFGRDKRFAPFWSLGFGINIHNYEFFKDINTINLLKVRASYGQTGKVNFPAYAAATYYTTITDQWYKTGIGTTLKALGNTSLKWETTNTIDAGFEFGMFSNRLYLSASYYNKKTTDLINDVTIASSTGFTTYRNNIGEILNEGVEVNLRAGVISTRDISFIVTGNLAHNKNKVLKVSNSLKEYNDRVQQKQTQANRFSDEFLSKPFMQYQEGASLDAIWGVKSGGINPANGEEIYIRPDGTLSDTWRASYQQVLGKSIPKIQGSISLSFSYKSVSLYTSFMYQTGGQTYNSTLADKVEGVNVYANNVDKRVLYDRWGQPGDIAKYRKIESDRLNAGYTRPTSRFVQNYNVLSWNSISVSYDIPNKIINKAGLSMLRAELGANDIIHLSNVKRERGTSYPFARTVNLSLKASF